MNILTYGIQPLKLCVLWNFSLQEGMNYLEAALTG
jgi:hypothetical protein